MSELKPFTGVDDRVRLADAIPLRTPFTLNIFPTNLCNFKCVYCAQSLGWQRLRGSFGMKPETMSVSTLRKIVEDSQSFPERFKLVSMMGHGEPLLNPHLPEMVRIVKDAGIAGRVDVITNGSLLNRDRGEALIEAGIDVIRISLQGVSSQKYRDVSGITFDFDEFLENLAYLYGHRKTCRIFVKVVDVALAEGEEERFYALFDQLSDRMFIDRVKPVYRGVSYAERPDEITVDRYGKKHERRRICPQPFYMLSVWPDGEVASCEAIYKAAPLGNVHTGSLRDMWASPVLREFRMLQLRGERHQAASCKSCCAPDDVVHPEDVLDGCGDDLLRRLGRDGQAG